MKLQRRHKYILAALAVYWPLVFTLTHIPVMEIARKSGMSDRTMHVMAYFALTFLFWCAVSPYRRVQWNRAKIWWVILVVAAYGALDEYLQDFVGRSCDLNDYAADLFGIMFASGVLSVFHFWSALLTAAVTTIFVISNLSDLTALYPQFHLNTVFHFSAYGGLTLIWMQHMERYWPFPQNRAAWPLIAAALPLTMLTLVAAAEPFYGKTVWWVDMATAAFAILGSVVISRLTFSVTRRNRAFTARIKS